MLTAGLTGRLPLASSAPEEIDEGTQDEALRITDGILREISSPAGKEASLELTRGAAMGVLTAADGVAGAVSAGGSGDSDAGERAAKTRSSIRGLLNRMASVQIGSMVPGEPSAESAGENVGLLVQRAYVDPAQSVKTLASLFDISTSSRVSFKVPAEASANLAGATASDVLAGCGGRRRSLLQGSSPGSGGGAQGQATSNPPPREMDAPAAALDLKQGADGEPPAAAVEGEGAAVNATPGYSGNCAGAGALDKVDVGVVLTQTSFDDLLAGSEIRGAANATGHNSTNATGAGPIAAPLSGVVSLSLVAGAAGTEMPLKGLLRPIFFSIPLEGPAKEGGRQAQPEGNTTEGSGPAEQDRLVASCGWWDASAGAEGAYSTVGCFSLPNPRPQGAGAQRPY